MTCCNIIGTKYLKPTKTYFFHNVSNVLCSSKQLYQPGQSDTAFRVTLLDTLLPCRPKIKKPNGEQLEAQPATIATKIILKH